MSKTVKFLFDYASPYAYFASKLLASELEGITVEQTPVYLRGFELFSKGMPYGAAKSAYIVKDLHRCSEHFQIEMRAPSVFPINGLYGLRAALVAQKSGDFDRLHPALFEAAWRDQRDISQKDEVIAIAGEVGLDAGRYAAGIADDAVKAQLKEQTAEAAAAGVFGVPAFLVDGELFWGHDRMGYVRRAALER